MSILLQAKIKDITGTGAKIAATDCPGCLPQISGGLDAADCRDIRAMHTSELLSLALAHTSPGE